MRSQSENIMSKRKIGLHTQCWREHWHLRGRGGGKEQLEKTHSRRDNNEEQEMLNWEPRGKHGCHCSDATEWSCPIPGKCPFRVRVSRSSILVDCTYHPNKRTLPSQRAVGPREDLEREHRCSCWKYNSKCRLY